MIVIENIEALGLEVWRAVIVRHDGCSVMDDLGALREDDSASDATT